MIRIKLCLIIALFVSAAPAFAKSGNQNSRPSLDATLTDNNEEGASSIPLINFLPFGAGQFSNGRPALGTFFASTELMSALLWLTMNNNLKDAKAQQDAVQGCQQNGKTDPACAEYYRQNESYTTGVRNLRNKAMIRFGLFYALGVMQAVMDTPLSLMAGTKDELDRNHQLRPGLQDATAPRRASEQRSSVRWGMALSSSTTASLHEPLGLALTLQFDCL